MIGERCVGAFRADLDDPGLLDLVEIGAGMAGGDSQNQQRYGDDERLVPFHFSVIPSLALYPACCECWKLTDARRKNKEQDFKNNWFLKPDSPDGFFRRRLTSLPVSPTLLRHHHPPGNSHGTIPAHGTFWIL
jgi:hypothetical protein